MTYFRDEDKGFIVRIPEKGIHLEYTYDDFENWTETEFDSSYEREVWFGEGDNCLIAITEEEAKEIIASRKADK